MKLPAIGVAPQKETQFNGKGIFSVEDLVRFLPRRYNDFSKETGILPEDQLSCLIVRVTKVQTYNNGVPMMLAFCRTEDEKLILVRWFRQNYLATRISNYIGRNVYLCGKLTYDPEYKNYSTTAPEMFEPKISEGMRIVPVYSKIPGMSTEYLEEKMGEAVSYPEVCAETLPYSIVADENLLPMREALYSIHFPKSMNQVKLAQERLLLDDLVYFALNTEYAARHSADGSAFGIGSIKLVNTILADLPFKLTADQQDAVSGMISLPI